MNTMLCDGRAEAVLVRLSHQGGLEISVKLG
jgi:hypothetical protein